MPWASVKAAVLLNVAGCVALHGGGAAECKDRTAGRIRDPRRAVSGERADGAMKGVAGIASMASLLAGVALPAPPADPLLSPPADVEREIFKPVFGVDLGVLARGRPDCRD